jgi:hypothetical protein
MGVELNDQAQRRPYIPRYLLARSSNSDLDDDDKSRKTW